MKTSHTAGTGRMLIWGSFLTIAGFVVWANWAELDQITRANGQVIASDVPATVRADAGVQAAYLGEETHETVGEGH